MVMLTFFVLRGKGIKNKQEYALLVNDLEKQFVKKKMKNYEKAITVEANINVKRNKK